MAKKKDVLLEHEYDGIQELDNELPPWWVYLFWITIIFAVVYMFHYHVFKTGDLQIAEYNKEIDPNWKPAEMDGNGGLIGVYRSPFTNPKGDVTPYIEEQFASYVGPKLTSDGLIMEAMRRADETTLNKLKTDFPDLFKQLSAGGAAIIPKKAAAKESIETVEALTDATSIAKGKEIFTKNCVSCHGLQGQGGIGPNLTDDYWLHGAGMSHIVHTITAGVPAKGMITWRGVLSPDQIKQAASYILTLHGSNPPNPKAPQGDKFEYPLQ